MIQPSYIEIVDGDAALKTELSATADCPICNQTLSIGDFGISKARPSGRNLYCKACIREKVAESRRALRAYRQVKRERKSQGDLPPRRNPDLLLGRWIQNPDYPLHERVLAAIHQGARTQKEILRAIKPSHQHFTERFSSPTFQRAMDHLGDALAILLVGHPQKIKTQVVDDVREYFAVAGRRSSVAATRRHA